MTKKKTAHKKTSKTLGLIVLLLAFLGIAYLILEDPMGGVQNGDSVKIVYSAYFEDGSLFKSYDSTNPLQFVVGVKNPNIEDILHKAVLRMKVGDKKEITAHPNETYGKYYDKKKIKNIPYLMVERFGLDPKVGDIVDLGSIKGKVLSIEGTGVARNIVLDTNDLQTWQDLKYNIELLEILK